MIEIREPEKGLSRRDERAANLKSGSLLRLPEWINADSTQFKLLRRLCAGINVVLFLINRQTVRVCMRACVCVLANYIHQLQAVEWTSLRRSHPHAIYTKWSCPMILNSITFCLHDAANYSKSWSGLILLCTFICHLTQQQIQFHSFQPGVASSTRLAWPDAWITLASFENTKNIKSNHDW